jgi:hypothetical protein
VPWDDDIINEACHMWRYGSDLFPIWGDGAAAPVSKRLLSGMGGPGVGDVIEFASSIYAYNWREVTGTGAFNDPDFLVVGCPTDRPCESGSTTTTSPSLSSSFHTVDAHGVAGSYPTGPPLSDIEQRTQFSMWCILAAPLILGSDVRSLSATALATLSNKAAIDINQDPTARQPQLVSKKSGSIAPQQVWKRDLSNGDVAVALLNTGSAPVDISLQLADVVCVSCPREATVNDVWAGDATLGSGSGGAPGSVDVKDVYTAHGVRPHETVLLRLTPKL